MNTDILKRFEQILENSNEMDQEAILQFITGMEKKQQAKKHTYLRFLLDWEVSDLENNSLQIKMPIKALSNNVHNMVHGGITASLLDNTLGTLAARQVPEDEGVVTTEIKVNYIKPGIGKYLKCIATLVHKGSKLIVVEGKVYNDKNDIVAIATGSFYIVKMRT